MCIVPLDATHGMASMHLQELARATHAAEQWRSQHAELHAFCVEAVLAQRGSARSGKG